MTHLLDPSILVYVVVALVPNLLVMLFVMARLHREVRAVSAKLGIMESDNRILDEGLKALGDEIRQLREREARLEAEHAAARPIAAKM